MEQAKQILIEYSGMTEDQAHRFLQKRSMDSGARMADTARQVLRVKSSTKPAKRSRLANTRTYSITM